MDSINTGAFSEFKERVLDLNRSLGAHVDKLSDKVEKLVKDQGITSSRVSALSEEVKDLRREVDQFRSYVEQMEYNPETGRVERKNGKLKDGAQKAGWAGGAVALLKALEMLWEYFKGGGAG